MEKMLVFLGWDLMSLPKKTISIHLMSVSRQLLKDPKQQRFNESQREIKGEKNPSID